MSDTHIIVVGVIDSTNDCDFAIAVPEGTDVELVENLAVEGLGAWYAAASGPDEAIEPTEHFDAEEIKTFYSLGYAEPTSILLTRMGIEHQIIDLEFTPDGNPVCKHVTRY